MKPLLYINLNTSCPENIPEKILNSLKRDFQSNIQNSLLLTSELVKIMKLLELNGIEAVPYKGPILSYTIYNNIGYRQFGDIDILIKEEDALEVKNIMLKQGYDFLTPITIDDEYYMKFATEHQFINRANNSIIEIKWKFAGDFFSFPSKSDILSNNLIEIDINGFKMKTFSPENQLLVLCIHAGKHSWTRLSWICDISEFIQKENINWDETLKKAENLRVKRILLVNLFLAKELFGFEVPTIILDQFDNDKSVKKISLQVKKRIFIDQKYSLSLFEKFFSDIKKRENIFDGIKDSFNGLTKPGYKDYEDLPLPPYLFPLYRLIRPFLLLKRYGKKPV